jgi:hypothetical protein
MAGWHKVKQGECLSSLAARYRLSDWRAIHNHPNNTSFFAARTNPNVLSVGDWVYVPDMDASPKSGAIDEKNTYVCKRDRTLLRLVIADEFGEPYSQAGYTLEIGDDRFEGNTDEQGMLERRIDPAAPSGVLTIRFPGAPRRHCTWRLKFGHLDPVDQVTGIQARLNNLGFASGPVDGVMGPVTTEAVRAFQRRYDLRADGNPDSVTQAKLEEVHGC